MEKPKDIKKVSLLYKEDELKSGQWWDWACEIEYTNGRLASGYIQSDGHRHAFETLEIDEEVLP